jgi:hypothetical protein
MELSTIAFIIETVVFWAFVYLIVFMGCETPAIVFTGFGAFLFYWLFRFVAKQEGADKMIWIYVVNMIITIMLLFYFLTGSPIQKSIRNALNSAARKYPTLDPYVKRC